MKINFKEEKKNSLLKRKEILALVDHEGGATPSKEDIKKKLAAEKDWDVEKIEVDYVHSIYGSAFSKSRIKVWEKARKKIKKSENKKKVEVDDKSSEQETEKGDKDEKKSEQKEETKNEKKENVDKKEKNDEMKKDLKKSDTDKKED